MKDCILILTGNEPEDLADLNRCLALLGYNVLPFCRGEVDVLVFHEAAFHPFLSQVVSTFPLQFVPVEFRTPDYPPEIAATIPEFFQHPTQTARGRPGFTLGYRHMCRFFAGAMYEHPALAGYRRYLRLDTDSAILTPLGYDLFAWAEERDVAYGYLATGIQNDCPLVGQGFREAMSEWWRGQEKMRKRWNEVSEHRVYYTNIELGEVAWFQSPDYIGFFRHLDATGGFYTRRWGDHLVKYAGVNMFMDPERIVPFHGFVYQHGAVYRLATDRR